VLSRLDYGGVTLACLAARPFERLLSALDAVTRLVFELRKCELVTRVLRDLHSLRVPQLARCNRSRFVPRYPDPVVGTDSRHRTLLVHLVRAADIESRQRSASSTALVVLCTRQLAMTAPLLLPLLECGTAFHIW